MVWLCYIIWSATRAIWSAIVTHHTGWDGSSTVGSRKRAMLFQMVITTSTHYARRTHSVLWQEPLTSKTKDIHFRFPQILPSKLPGLQQLLCIPDNLNNHFNFNVCLSATRAIWCAIVTHHTGKDGSSAVGSCKQAMLFQMVITTTSTHYAREPIRCCDKNL